jgi:hypothetical protein
MRGTALLVSNATMSMTASRVGYVSRTESNIRREKLRDMSAEACAVVATGGRQVVCAGNLAARVAALHGLP